MRKWVRSSPVALGVDLVVLGVLVIGAGWFGASGKDFAEGQLPYLLSGGAIGLALVGAGLTVVHVQTRRQDHHQLLAKLDELAESMQAAGHGTGQLRPVPADDTLVMAGRSTFHRPDCRVVQGRADQTPMGRTAATDAGLKPCRICSPAADTA